MTFCGNVAGLCFTKHANLAAVVDSKAPKAISEILKQLQFTRISYYDLANAKAQYWVVYAFLT